MPYTLDQNLSQAFQYLIESLCIDQFPCGQGSWRSGNKWRCDSPDLLNPLKEPDANLESIQSLTELSQLHPFINTAEWSEDISSLRQRAIENPEHLSMKCIQKYFTTLRLSGMNIVDVDDGLLKFQNLKELTLAANRIDQLNPDNLPKQLELLELYGNKISDIKAIIHALPSLVHLGIGLNSLSSIIGSVQPSNWLHMMSLDLSHNELIMLKETLETLKVLPKLNNLLLQGNPLSLSVGYRGLVVDTLKQLSILDDIRITADEKYRYKSTSKLKGLPGDVAIMEININKLRGIQKPQEEENENGEEFPRREFRYQIFYSFPNKSKMKKKIRMKDVSDLDRDASESGRECEDKGSNSESDDDCCLAEFSGLDSDYYLRQRRTEEKHWSDDSIDINYEKTFFVLDMRDLKQYLSNGIVLKIFENKVTVSPEPPAPPDDSASVAGDGDVDKNKLGKSKKAPKDKPQQVPPPKVAGKDSKPRGKKKGKGEDVDLFELSRETKMIAENCLPLKDFVSGSKHLEVQTVFTLTEKKEIGKDIPCEESRELKLSSTKQSVAPDSKKKGKESRKLSPSASTSIQRNRSAMSTKGGKPEKTARIKDSKPLAEITETDGGIESLPDITIDVIIDLHTWKTAKEAQDWIIQNEAMA